MENGYRIMIVDDSAFARNLLKKCIIDLSAKMNICFDIIEAVNGSEAVELYDKYAPNLVFMDITMPVKDGLEALKEIKQKHIDAKIVMCSAMGQKAYVDEAINIGIIDFIVKPYNDKLDRIDKILGNINN